MARDHHSYVIADGRLVGAWDEMYDLCDDPWDQSADARSEGRQAILRYARDVGGQSVLEVGCGLGYFTEELAREGFDAVGIDVSEVAIERARHAHPALADRLRVGRAETDLALFQGVDVVVFAEVTWYLLPHLDSVLADLRRHHSGAHLIHLLSFYGADRQRYGREFFTTPDELIDRFGFDVVACSRSPSPVRADDYASTILFRIP